MLNGCNFDKKKHYGAKSIIFRQKPLKEVFEFTDLEIAKKTFFLFARVKSLTKGVARNTTL